VRHILHDLGFLPLPGCMQPSGKMNDDKKGRAAYKCSKCGKSKKGHTCEVGSSLVFHPTVHDVQHTKTKQQLEKTIRELENNITLLQHENTLLRLRLREIGLIQGDNVSLVPFSVPYSALGYTALAQPTYGLTSGTYYDSGSAGVTDPLLTSLSGVTSLAGVGMLQGLDQAQTEQLLAGYGGPLSGEMAGSSGQSGSVSDLVNLSAYTGHVDPGDATLLGSYGPLQGLDHGNFMVGYPSIQGQSNELLSFSTQDGQ